MTTRLLAFSGSTRHGSLNSQVLQTAIAGAESIAGCTVTLINLNDYPMPLYNGDDEQAHGMPETTQNFCAYLRSMTAYCLHHQNIMVSLPH